MKPHWDEAVELFRGNEALAGGDREKSNLYRGLTLLVEGLQALEKEITAVESEMQDGPSHFYYQKPRVQVSRGKARAKRAGQRG